MTLTLGELRAKWEARRGDPVCAGSLVAMDLVCAEIIADLRALASDGDEGVTFKEAARLGGYSVDHLQRLVAGGEIENIGRKHRPRIRRRDVPKKPGFVLTDDVSFDRRRIVASVITGNEEGS